MGQHDPPDPLDSAVRQGAGGRPVYPAVTRVESLTRHGHAMGKFDGRNGVVATFSPPATPNVKMQIEGPPASCGAGAVADIAHGQIMPCSHDGKTAIAFRHVDGVLNGETHAPPMCITSEGVRTAPTTQALDGTQAHDGAAAGGDEYGNQQFHVRSPGYRRTRAPAMG